MLKNSETSYGSVAKWLHWITALLFLLSYVFVYYLIWFVDHDDRQTYSYVQNYHKAIGFSVLIFFFLRIYWRAVNPNPKLPDHMPWWQKKASHAMHYLLYFLMIAMPVSGYLGNGSGVNYGFFRIDGFRRTPIGSWILEKLDLTWQQWQAPFDYFHYGLVGPNILWVLISAHILAALYHHFIEKDDVLTNMLPSKKPSGEVDPDAAHGESNES